MNPQSMRDAQASACQQITRAVSERHYALVQARSVTRKALDKRQTEQCQYQLVYAQEQGLSEGEATLHRLLLQTLHISELSQHQHEFLKAVAPDEFAAYVALMSCTTLAPETLELRTVEARTKLGMISAAVVKTAVLKKLADDAARVCGGLKKLFVIACDNLEAATAVARKGPADKNIEEDVDVELWRVRMEDSQMLLEGVRSFMDATDKGVAMKAFYKKVKESPRVRLSSRMEAFFKAQIHYHSNPEPLFFGGF
jgi:hypothetical protein